VSASLVRCASVELPDLKPHITLPASQEGFWVSTLTDEEGSVPYLEWRSKLRREPHIILFSDDWAKLRFTILKNCMSMDCKQAVGALDDLFYTFDAALKGMMQLPK
jgi:hypothetical protein